MENVNRLGKNGNKFAFRVDLRTLERIAEHIGGDALAFSYKSKARMFVVTHDERFGHRTKRVDIVSGIAMKRFQFHGDESTKKINRDFGLSEIEIRFVEGKKEVTFEIPLVGVPLFKRPNAAEKAAKRKAAHEVVANEVKVLEKEPVIKTNDLVPLSSIGQSRSIVIDGSIPVKIKSIEGLKACIAAINEFVGIEAAENKEIGSISTISLRVEDQVLRAQRTILQDL